MTTAYQPKPVRKRGVGGVQLGVDAWLVGTVLVLLLFGLVMVFSASWELSYFEYDSHTKMFTRQFGFMLFGLAAAGVATYVDYHHYRKWSKLLIAIAIGGLILVLILKNVRFNATRTLYEGSGMPSEAAKLAIILYLCVWLYSKRHQLHEVGFGILPLSFMIGFMGMLIMFQPDVSAAFTLVILGGVLFFVAGGKLPQIFVLLMIGLLSAWLVVQFQATARERVTEYYTGLVSPTDADFHVRRSMEAFVRGGFFGTGIDRSVTKLQGLPVPPTDSIFAVVAEETGVVGTTGLILLYAVLAWRGMKIASDAPDMLGQLLATGLTFWIVFEAVINMGVMVGLVPFAGNALPFISLGGSSLVMSLCAIGILLNISRQSKMGVSTRERTEYASDGISRGNRRGDLSRAGRSTSARR